MIRARAIGPAPSFLAEVIPPRGLTASISAARGMFAALVSESCAFEIAVTEAGPRWYVRASAEDTLERILAQVRLAYPQAIVERVSRDRGDLDPTAVIAPESSIAADLRSTVEYALPLRTDWRNERDPLAGVLTSAAVSGGERVVCRFAVGPVPRGSATRIRKRAAERTRTWQGTDRQATSSAWPLLALMAVCAAALQGWRWYEARAWMLLVPSVIAALVVLPFLAAIVPRIRGNRNPLPAAVVEDKLAAPLLAAYVVVCAFGHDTIRLRALVTWVTTAFAGFDDAAGGGLRAGVPRRFAPGATGPRLDLNAAELAVLWHLPNEADAPASVRRTTASRLAPAPGHAVSGARVGTTDAAARSAPVYLPAPLLYRNQLIVAKTRRGKSTLLRHIAAGLMERVAAGTDDAALVVVDPHQDLAEAVLASIPEALVERAAYLDFSNLERPVGLNLLDVGLFPDRDRTTEHVVMMLNRLWPANWGPRMEGALRASLSCLLELNTKRARDEQYTLLDVGPFLTDHELRKSLLREVQDPSLQAWWRDNYDRAGRVLQQQTANPVTSKIGRFTVTEASRLVLGQSRSTFDPRALLREGGVLVVNTAVGALGEGAASLVGATLLNLLGLLIEEQVFVPSARRQRVVTLVDESSTLGAVDYPWMLSELGKYGASFVLVTQSLSKLDAIDRNLAPTIFANTDGVTVFQVSAEDARRLTPELGSDITVDDLISLDDFACCARWWDGYARPAAFTFRVDPPPPLISSRVATVAQRSALRHGRPREEVVAEITQALLRYAPRDDEERPGRGKAQRLGRPATKGADPQT